MKKSLLPVLCVLFLILSGCGGNTELSEREHLKRASVFEAQLDINSALIEYKNAVRLNAFNADSRWRLGKLYLKLKQGKLAEKELTNAKNMQPDNKAIKVDLARALLIQYKYSESLELLDSILDDVHGNASTPILLLRAKALAALLKNDEARQVYEDVLAAEPGNIDATVGLAQVAINTNKWPTASRLLNDILTDLPDNIDALLVKGDLYRLRGQDSKALTVYNRVVELEPRNITAHLSRAHIFLSEGNVDAALIDTELLKKFVPDYPISTYLQAISLYNKGDYDGAEDALNKVLKAVPNHASSLLLLAFIKYKAEAYTEAMNALDLYLTQRPADLHARKLMASIELQIGNPEGAISTLAPILDISKHDIEIAELLSTAHVQVGNAQQAADILKDAIEQNPSSSEPRVSLGMLQAASNQQHLAGGTFQSALEVDPDSVGVNAIVALNYLREKKYSDARQGAEMVIAKSPEQPLGYYLRALVSIAQQQLDAAYADLEESLQRNKEFIPAITAIAKIEVVRGRPNALQERLEEILKEDNQNVLILTQLALNAEEKKRFFEATQYWQKVVQLSADNVVPHLALTRSYLRIGETRKAVATALNAQSAYGNDATILEVLGVAQLEDGQTDYALRTLTKLVEESPGNAVFHYRLAKAQLASGDVVGATNSLEESMGLDANFAPALQLLFKLQLDSGQATKAEASANRLRELLPDSPLGLLAIGKVLLAKADYSAAAEIYRVGYQRFKTRDFLVDLYQALRLGGGNVPSRELLRQWINDHPDDLAIHALLAGALLLDGFESQAAEAFEKIVAAAPNAASAHNNLAWLYQRKGDPRSLIHAKKAHQIKPDDSAYSDTLGWIQVQQGQLDQGIALLQQTVAKNPHLRQVRYHLASALLADGQRKAALQHLRRALNEGDFDGSDEAKVLLKELESDPDLSQLHRPLDTQPNTRARAPAEKAAGAQNLVGTQQSPPLSADLIAE